MSLNFGMNPSFHCWWGREIVFADAMKRASEFVLLDASQQPTRNPARLRTDAWPDERCSARLFGDMDGTIPAGNYVVTWEEDGNVEIRGNAVVREVSRGTRHLVVEVKNDGALFAVFTPPVKAVRIWLPGMEATKPLFWPAYVSKVKAMNRGRGPATWRTLDWTLVNDYGRGEFVFDLAGAILPTSPSQGTKRGICPEFQAEFCNAVGANLHFNIPHRTDEITEPAYVQFVSRQIRAIYRTLAPHLTLTVELSNEIWNDGFPQNRWFKKEAAARGITLEQEVARELSLFWPYLAKLHPGARRYIGGHTTTPDFMRDILAALPVSMRVDALGPACYIRVPREVVDGWLVGAVKGGACPNCPTPLQVIQGARQSLTKIRQGLRSHRVMATQRGAKLELYEGGQSFIAGFQPWKTAANQAQVLPELYHLYVDDIIPMLVEEGVDLISWYSFMNDQAPGGSTPIGFGCWNDMNQTITLPVPASYLDERAPKAAAIYRGPPT